MQITHAEFRDAAGHVTIHREHDSPTIRIDSVLREPGKEQAWMTWDVPATVSNEELFKIAEIVQRRCAGVRGTGSDIHGYFQELQRFQD